VLIIEVVGDDKDQSGYWEEEPDGFTLENP
jgi:hypothetical protein